MANDLDLKGEERNKNVSLLVSTLLHLLLTLIIFVTGFTYYDPPLQPLNAVLVAFSESEEASELASNQSPEEIQETTKEEQTEQSSQDAASNNTNSAQSSITEDDAVILSNPKSQDQNKPIDPVISKADLEKKLEAERRAKAAAEKEEAERKKKAELEKSKQKFSDILGKGKGNNSSSNNEGEDGTNELDQLSKGSGSVGPGFGNRSVVFEPVIHETSQKRGVVVIAICINASGDVVKAKYTQSGSTTTDRKLVSIAEKAARKYKFTSSDTPEQCGDIVIEFKVQ